MANKDYYDRIADALEIISGDTSHIDDIDKNMDYYKRIADALENIAGGSGVAEEAGLIETTWSELKELRDNGELVPGAQYRITDYVCTVANDENARVESHPYDIIVVADSESVLNENARAAMKEGDNYYHVDGQTDAVLEAWKLKYCLDNDTSRFAWADETNGKGVVYWLRDDRDNECWYDFKQIQFKRFKITAFDKAPSSVGKYIVKPTSGMTVDTENPEWHFTFYVTTEDGEVLDASVIPINKSVTFSNIIGCCFTIDNFTPTNPLILCNNTFGVWCFNNTFGSNCCNNTFENDCHNNTFGNSCMGNTFGNGSFDNILMDTCYYNTFVCGCNGNIFGTMCTQNTFLESCQNNTFGDNYQNNTFGAGCNSNTFGNQCWRNAFKKECHNNTFGNSCSDNTFGNGCHSNTFGNSCSNNTFGNGCHSNTFGKTCQGNTFGNKCLYNIFEDECNNNTLGDNCSKIKANNTTNYCNVISGVGGTTSAHLILAVTANNKYTTYVGYNTAGELKYWNPMDAATS